MEMRRAILLFAIVLGLAALVTSFTRPAGREDGERDTSRAPQEQPADPPSAANERSRSASSSAAPAELRFPAGARVTQRPLEPGRAATLTVEVLAPGQVTIDDLGLSGVAEPGTPARFEVFTGEPGRHPITFTPANGADGRTIGVLRVRAE